MAVRHDLTFVRGADWILDGTATDGAGTVIDLTSATIKFRISTNAATPVTVDTRQTGGSGITITSAPAGTYRVVITDANQDSASISASTMYRYEVQVTTTGGTVYDQLYGQLKVEPSLF